MNFARRLDTALVLLEFLGDEYLLTPISPKDIYSFYYTTVKYQQGTLSEYDKSLVKMFLQSLRKKYLKQLAPLVQEQLRKYLGRQRIDQGAYVAADIGSNPAELDRLMRTTYRSDMTSRNTVWESFTDNLAGLDAANSTEQILFYLDRINNDIHNTGEAVLTKLPGGYELEQALEACHNADDRQLRAGTYSDLRFR